MCTHTPAYFPLKNIDNTYSLLVGGVPHESVCFPVPLG